MPVITPVDLEPILHIDIGNNADPTVVAMIARAQETVEGALGRKIETATGLVDIFRGHFRRLILSAWPVTALTSVVENGVTLTVDTDYQWDENGVLVRYVNGDPRIWERIAGQIVVTYTAGFPTTHVGYKDLAGVVLRVAVRMWQAATAYAAAPAGTDAVRQETLGSYSVTYASDPDNPVSNSSYLIDDDYRVVARWR